MKEGGASKRPVAALRVLVVEDEPDLRETLGEAIRDAGHVVVLAADGEEGLSHVTKEVFDVVITDVNLPKVDGPTLLRAALSSAAETRVILITAFGEISMAVAALKEGAYDYLAKPFELEHLLAVLARVAAERQVERELAQARTVLAGISPQTLLVGESPPMRRVLAKVDMVAGSDAAALVVGESGTGKEIVARLIHDRGRRRAGPYVAVNCGALTETLMEAELFGHEKGAFTGAERKRDGRFKAADGGTLFLDEVAELPLAAQAKLLRVLQEGTFEPLGSNASVKVDVRVISATHRDLRERVRKNLFREDLFYRINVIEIDLPPLRERPGDLALLVHHFLGRLALKGTTPSISAEAWETLARHRFPGNVRELSHAIQHAIVMAGGREIQSVHLPAGIQTESVTPAAPAETPRRKVRPLLEAARDFERECLSEAMEQAHADRAVAARLLGLSAKALADKLRAHGL